MLLPSFVRRLFGHDIFISYSRRDGATYAAGLANELVKRGFACKLDLWGTQPGQQIPPQLRRAVRSSSLLVVAGSPGTAISESVQKEIREFLTTEGPIIPIDFSGAARNAIWWPLIEGLALSEESPDALETGNPTPQLLNRIEKAYEFTRRDNLLRRAAWIVGGLLLALLIAALLAYGVARQERTSAQIAKQDAQTQKAAAYTAQKEAKVQKDAARMAENNARHQQEIAQESLAEARRQQRIAERAEARAAAQQQIAQAKTIEAQHQQSLAVRRERQVRANLLASEAEVASSNYPQRSILFAIEALRATTPDPPTPAATQALRQGLANLGGRPLTGSIDGPRKILVSPDGRWLVTGDYSDVVRLWDLSKSEATPSRSLPGTGGSIRLLAISPNGRWLVAEQEDLLRMWSLEDPSAPPLTFLFEDEPVQGLLVRDRWVLTQASSHRLLVWDLEAEDVMTAPIVLSGLPDATDQALFAISLDGRRVAAWDGKGPIRLWNAPDGAFEDLAWTGDTQSTDHARVLEISPDANWLAAGSSSVLDTDKSLGYLWNLAVPAGSRQPIELQGHPKGLGLARFSPDSRWLVTAGARNLIEVGLDEKLRLWDLASGRQDLRFFELLGHTGAVADVAIDRSSRWLLTGSYDQTALLWNLAAPDPSAKPRVLQGHASWVDVIGFTQKGRWAVTGSGDQTVKLWPLSEGSSDRPMTFRGHEGEITALGLTPDDRWLISGSRDHTLRLWDLVALQSSMNPIVLDAHFGYADIIIEPKFTPDRRWMVTQGEDMVQLWDLKTPGLESYRAIPLETTRTYIPSLVLSPNGRWMVLAEDHRTRLWDLTVPDLLAEARSLPGQMSVGTRFIFSDDDRWLLTSEERDNQEITYLCSLSEPGMPCAPLQGYDKGLSQFGGVRFSPDSLRLVTQGNEAGTVYLWNVPAIAHGDKPRTLRGHQSKVSEAAFSSDGRWLATAAWDAFDESRDDHAARLWDLTAPEQEPKVLTGHRYAITELVFSPDGRWLVTANAHLLMNPDGSPTIRLWDLSQPDGLDKPFVLPGLVDRITEVSFSPDGRWLLTGSNDDANLRLWDLTASDPSAAPEVLRGHKEQTGDHSWEVAFSRDGHWLASGNFSDEFGRLWDLTNRHPSSHYRLLSGHSRPLNGFGFSPDGKWLITVSADSSARLWSLQPQEDSHHSTLLGGHDFSIDGVTFADEGQRILTWGGGSVRLWTLDLAEMLGLAQLAVGRNLTWGEWVQAEGSKRYQKSFADLPVDHSVIDGLLEQAGTATLAGDRKAAASIYRDLVKWSVETHDPGLCNKVCWQGSLDGFPEIVLSAGEHAVQWAPESSNYHDTRGVARAMTGDFAGALKDFAIYVDATRQSGRYENYGSKREGWMRKLASGQNPFDPTTLKALRDE
jgi:WD40 repeat protein